MATRSTRASTPIPIWAMISATRQIGGLGLFLVRESADDLQYHHDLASGWNELVVIKREATAMFELMRALPIFKGFPDADLTQLAANMAEQHLRAGEVLFWQGEEGHECYVILAGETEVIAHPGRSEVRLEVRQAGQIIGEMALIDPSPRSATVRALTDSHVAVLGERAFTALMHATPS